MKSTLILALTLITFYPVVAVSKEKIKAVTDDGREVVLSLEDKTWEYAPTVFPDANVVYENDLVRMTYAGTESVKTSSVKTSWPFYPSLKIFIRLEALKPTNIVKYRTHHFYRNEITGESFSYPDVVRNVTDNFGNSYRVCVVNIDGEQANSYEFSEGIFYGEPKTLTIGVCGKVLKAANNLSVKISPSLFYSGTLGEIDIKVPIPRE